MKWKSVIQNWLNKNPPFIPSSLNHNTLDNGYYFQTTCIDYEMNNEYKYKFIETNGFKLTQDYTAYKEYINKSNNKYATHFYSLTGKTILVIPMPRINKNFSHLRAFYENASETHIKEFWKYVAKIVIKLLKKNMKLYIHTHGKEIPYLHLRIECCPKDYYDQRFLIECKNS